MWVPDFKKGANIENKHITTVQPGQRSEVFAGSCAELKGLTLDCGQPHHAESYSRAIEGIINHVRVIFREGILLARTIATDKLVPVLKPVVVLDDTGVPSTDDVDVAIFNAKIKSFVSREVTYETSLGQGYCLVWGNVLQVCDPTWKQWIASTTRNQHQICWKC